MKNVLKETPIDGLYLNDYKFVVDNNKLRLCESSDLMDIKSIKGYTTDVLETLRFEDLSELLDDATKDFGKIVAIATEFDYLGFIYQYDDLIFIYKKDNYVGDEFELINSNWYYANKLRSILKLIFNSLASLNIDIKVKYSILNRILFEHHYTSLELLDNGHFLLYTSEILGIILEFNIDLTIYKVHLAELLANTRYSRTFNLIEGNKVRVYLIDNDVNIRHLCNYIGNEDFKLEFIEGDYYLVTENKKVKVTGELNSNLEL